MPSAPGRGDALVGRAKVDEALDLTGDFLRSTYRPVAQVAARGGSLKEALAACRAACDPKFSNYAIYEHCLPFNVARAYDEALGIDTPRIWTAERDRQMWEELAEDETDGLRIPEISLYRAAGPEVAGAAPSGRHRRRRADRPCRRARTGQPRHQKRRRRRQRHGLGRQPRHLLVEAHARNPRPASASASAASKKA